ncbi:prolipoprotein diacylglyceryl transferase [Allopontixanthobacter sediminis]|uniref:Phosphatidylglycerol--prolipoprotein diacylglyceryl transferase n=1 Tax=Allopontixanthobacter sediminis TaxID=1689985 RepID=A0A845B1U0_9SPHN|nr:prolipoprotein diacylglyceryl transferase [Allopontixanthobacter sediminis]MXP44248.1 prolipoprotein diacylglyceryl transferase [Allopontixanthobacter sediminis]
MLSLLASAAASDPIQWAELGLKPGIEIGSFTLRYYSLAYLGGLLFAYWHLSKMLREPGAPMAQRHADDLFFYCTLGIILGGRLGYAMFYDPALFTSFEGDGFVSYRLLRLWDGGMSFHGGLMGVLAAIAFVSWRGQLSFLRVCDYIAVNVPVGMMLGRLANFVNGELWGRVITVPSDVPWAMVFPGAGPLARHPSQLYQAALEGAILVVILLYAFWRTRARYRPGLMVGMFTTGVSIGRFVSEFFREPDAQLADFARETGLSMGQWLTIPLIVLGIAVMARALIRRPLASGTKGDPAPA